MRGCHFVQGVSASPQGVKGVKEDDGIPFVFLSPLTPGGGAAAATP